MRCPKDPNASKSIEGTIPSRSKPDVVTVNRLPQTLQSPGKRFAVGENYHAADLVETAFKSHQAEFMIWLQRHNLCVDRHFIQMLFPSLSRHVELHGISRSDCSLFAAPNASFACAQPTAWQTL